MLEYGTAEQAMDSSDHLADETEETAQQSTPIVDNVSTPNFVDKDDPKGKDAIELELERLVFGDDAGFQDEIKAYKHVVSDLDYSEIEDEGENWLSVDSGDDKVTDLQQLDDADVCK